MKLIVGLGNPGPQYSNTRHNIGFLLLDRFAKNRHFSENRSLFEARVAEGFIESEKVLLCWPQTYMNLSGRAVSAILRYFKADLTDLVVVHDDMDFPLGRIKVLREGGAAGHRGVSSIQENLKTKTFCRFRLGIGRPETKNEVIDFVLLPFKKEEKPLLEATLKKAEEGLAIWIKEGVQGAIAFCHRVD